MKKHSIYAIIAAAALAASCSLEEESYTSVSREQYMEDAAQAESVLLGVYSDMGVDGIYRYNLSFLFDLPNDQAKAEGNSVVGTRMIPANAYTNTQAEIQDTWAALYKAIYDANLFIESARDKMPSWEEGDQALGEYYVAEAKALRGLMYFELVRWYGHVPLMTSSSQSLDAAKVPQAAPKDVYAFIEKDLKEAAEVLPYASDDNLRTSNGWRMSKGAVLGLLAKVYATWAGQPLNDSSKWADAAAAAAEVVKSGKHSLLPDFQTLWTNAANNVWAPEESLIEISFYSAQSTTVSSGRIGKWNGVTAQNGSIKGNYNIALYRAIPMFLAEWPDHSRDKRWALSFADYKYTTSTGKTAIFTYTDDNGKTQDGTFELACAEDAKQSLKKNAVNNLTPGKWDIERYVKDENQVQDNNLSNVNWYILRYSDVLLLYAEALNEANNGPTSEAYDAINQVRRRAYGFSTSRPSYVADLTGLDYEAFRQAVRDERGRELAYEGQRRQDLVRWGIYYESVKQTELDYMLWDETGAEYYIAGQYTQKNKNELLPIPQREVDLCGYKQNEGWK